MADLSQDIGAVEIEIGGKKRRFDITNAKLPDYIDDNDLTADDYPYNKKLKRSIYEADYEALQIELVKMLGWMGEKRARVVCVFEGRDAAGKGGTIASLRDNLNPRAARNVALTKPTDTEREQWYFQRYIAHMPTGGEFVTFDRSWYNRAGVEPVMGFCTPEQHKAFLEAAPQFEDMLVKDGIYFFKFWLNISQETQLKRFHDRWHTPTKRWKFSPIDLKGISLWDDYSKRRDEMLKATHSKHAPWTVLRANDKRRLRLEVMRHVLLNIPYAGKDTKTIGKADPKIIGNPKDILG